MVAEVLAAKQGLDQLARAVRKTRPALLSCARRVGKVLELQADRARKREAELVETVGH